MKYRYHRGNRVRLVREFMGVPAGTKGKVIDIDTQFWHLTYRILLETRLPISLWITADAIEPDGTLSFNPDIDLSEVL